MTSRWSSFLVRSRYITYLDMLPTLSLVQKCFLISMCLLAGLLDGCTPVVIAPFLSQKIVVGFVLPNPSCWISIQRLRASLVASESVQYFAS